MSKKLKKSEALSEVAKVLQAALDEYEALEKSFGEESEEEEKEQEAEAEQAAAEGEEAPSEEFQDEEEGQPSEEEQAAAEAQAQDENADQEDEESMDDETLKSEFAKMQTAMQKRGLLNKTERAAAPAADLKKYETEVSSLKKTVDELTAAIKKISSTPAPRKGATGYSPLKKNTEEDNAQPLNKGEVVTKLLDLKKSGKQIPTGLINRVEGNRLSQHDVTYIKGLIG